MCVSGESGEASSEWEQGLRLPSPRMDDHCCSGELYPVETDVRLCEELETGREVEVDMVNDVLTDLTTGRKYSLKPLGDVSGGHEAPRVLGVGGALGMQPYGACSGRRG